MNVYYVDGKSYHWVDLIHKAQQCCGYKSEDGILTTSEAAEALRKHGHEVTALERERALSENPEQEKSKDE